MSDQHQTDLRIEGVKVKVNNRALVVTSESPLKVLSSAVLNGGLTTARSIFNCHVPKNFKNPKPAVFLQKVATRLAVPIPTVGLMTAVRVKNLSVRREEGEKVASIITAGSEPAAAAGDRIKLVNNARGTINTILIIDASLTDGAMVETVKTATEAKSLAVRDLDLRSRFSGDVASGTITDSVCVACTGRGKSLAYTGTGTPVGQAIARSVREGVEEAMGRESDLRKERSLIRRLRERGVRLDDLVETGMELFVGSRAWTRARTAALLRRGLIAATSDPNVSSLLIAAMRLDEDGKVGAIPGLTAEAFAEDPINLVTDETLGIAIANYIAGTLGVHNFLYYDRIKPGIAKTLGPFMDDAVCGLAAGVMSKVLREES